VSRGILILNDQNITLFTSAGEVVSEPGFAELNEDGIITGQGARNSAWLEPQHNFCNYWYQINQRPIKPKQKWARHNADIAYAQLRSILARVSNVQQLMLFVPGHFSDEQSALIVGIVKANSIDVIKITDSALLVNAMGLSQYVAVELTLHQAIVSSVQCSNIHNQRISTVVHQQIIPDTGSNQIHNTLARYISDKFIQQHRYDPLHNSKGEQALYDNINGWIKSLCQQNKLLVTVESDGGALSISLQRDEVIQLLEQRLDALKNALAQPATGEIILAEDTDFLASFMPTVVFQQKDAKSLALIDEIFKQPSHWDAGSPSLIRDQSLVTDMKESGDVIYNRAKRSLPTHILLNGQAWPMAEKLSIHYHDNHYVVQTHQHNNALAVLELEKDKLLVKTVKSDPIKELHFELIVGEKLTIGDINLQLIEVIDG
jgi:hypothetical protein